MPRISVGAVVAAGMLLVGCHTITEELPTEPTEAAQPATTGTGMGTGVLTVSIPALSLATTTPAPAATPAPGPAAPAPPSAPAPPPEEAPAPAPVNTGDCGSPTPPPIQKVKAYIHIRGTGKYTLDATPLVAGAAYCAQIGFTDGRNRCPVRQEGHPEREACEAYAVGNARDTGRTGPTWTRNGDYCNGDDCENHPDNQYLLWARKGGHYEACVKNGTCGSVDVDR